MGTRELTRAERAAIRKLATGSCANYDHEYGCLPLDCPCYMLGKCWTGAYCKYFQNAVLPLDPALAVSLTGGGASEPRSCAFCGTPFPADGKRAYCSTACYTKARRKQKREYIRKKRRSM
jgi:hypothetical protein